MPNLNPCFPSEIVPGRSVQFVFNRETNTDHTIGLLRQEYPLHKIHPISIQRQYLDTFDWRLYQSGVTSGVDSQDSEHLFFLHHKTTDSRIWKFIIDTIPKFPCDIPNESCRELLEAILGIRALVTVAAIHIECKKFLVLNKENKILAALQIESYSIEGSIKNNNIPDRLLVFPIKGYKKTFQDIVQYITRHLQLSCTSNDVIDEIHAVTGQTPGSGSHTLPRKLSDSLSIREAAQILLTHLLNIMQTNEPGIRAAIDTEFLHDYRVAVRRTRSFLGQIKQVFPDKVTEHFKQEFRWLGTITGSTRDLDIYLLKFEEYMRALPLGLRNDLIPFRQFMVHHWKIEHDRLCRALESKRYRKLLNTWQQTLEKETIRSQDAVDAKKSAKQIASQRIWQLYKRILKEGLSINEQSSDEDLHELRKTCKKFRYLIEFFHDYYPEKEIKKLLKTLKLLQANLGDFQDLSIQIRQLNQFAQAMQDERLAETKTIMAMGVLVEKLTLQKQTVRAAFRNCFMKFISPSKRTEFSNTLRAHPQSPSKGISI